MKIRNGFVSNSSSSSFVINKKGLTDNQIDFILHPENYLFIIKNMYLKSGDYDNNKNEDEAFDEWFDMIFGSIDELKGWDITDSWLEIRGETVLDNFDYLSFLDFFGISYRE